MLIQQSPYKKMEARKKQYLEMINKDGELLNKEYKHLRSCIICGSHSNDFRYNIKNMNYVQCSNCRLIYVNPWLSKSKALDKMNSSSKAFYFSKIYIPTHETILNYEIKHWERELRHIKKYKKTGKVLDVGCGIGLWLDCLSKHGYECTGIEVNSILSNYVMKKLKLDVLNTSFEDASLPEEEFDAITFFETLYYHYDPYRSLKKAFSLLKEGGIICVSVFNIDSLILKYFPENIRNLTSLDMPFHFSRNTLIIMMEKAGFSITKTRSVGNSLEIESIIKHVLGKIVSISGLRQNRNNREDRESVIIETETSKEVVKGILKPFNKFLNTFVRLIKKDFKIIVYGKKI